MASIVYDSYLDDLQKGNIVPNTDTFFLLLTLGYTPNKGTDTKRNASGIVSGEITGTGYTAGGAATTATVSLDTTNNRSDVTFGSVSWTTATISASGGVIYKSRGGASSADNLVAFVDFGSTVSSTAATFSVTFSSPLRFQN
jgi:hypothetical protein